MKHTAMGILNEILMNSMLCYSPQILAALLENSPTAGANPIDDQVILNKYYLPSLDQVRLAVCELNYLPTLSEVCDELSTKIRVVTQTPGAVVWIAVPDMNIESIYLIGLRHHLDAGVYVEEVYYKGHSFRMNALSNFNAAKTTAVKSPTIVPRYKVLSGQYSLKPRNLSQVYALARALMRDPFHPIKRWTIGELNTFLESFKVILVAAGIFDDLQAINPSQSNLSSQTPWKVQFNGTKTKELVNQILKAISMIQFDEFDRLQVNISDTYLSTAVSIWIDNLGVPAHKLTLEELGDLGYMFELGVNLDGKLLTLIHGDNALLVTSKSSMIKVHTFTRNGYPIANGDLYSSFIAMFE